ncbi:MAG: translocation/assembly module TamB domain-containing protein [Halanaerobiaceae bacterium]
MRWRIIVISCLILMCFTSLYFLYIYRVTLFESGLEFLKNFLNENISEYKEVTSAKKFKKIEIDPEIFNIFSRKIFRQPLEKLKDNLEQYFEEKMEVELEIGDISLWPLNRVILKEVIIEKEEGKYIKSDEVQIYYNLLKMFKNPENWQDGLGYINIVEPEMEFSSRETMSTDGLDFEKDIPAELSSTLSDFEIYLDNGSLFLENEDKEITAREITGVIKGSSSNNLEMNLKSRINLRKFNWQEYELKEVELGQVWFDYNYSRSDWQGKIKTSDIDLASINQNSQILADINSGLDFNLSEIEGMGQAVFELTGEDSIYPEQYRGKVLIEEGKTLLDYDQYFESREIENLNTVFSVNSEAQEKFKVEKLNFIFAGNPFLFEGDITNDSNTTWISGKLVSDNFKPETVDINWKQMEELNLSGNSRISLDLEGKIADPDIEVNFHLPRGQLKGKPLNSLKVSLRREENLIYLDFLEADIDQDNHLFLKGVYNQNTEKYSLDLNGENIKLDFLKNNLKNWNYTLYNNIFQDKLDNVESDINGELELELFLSGRGFDWNNLNGMGKMKVNSPEFGYNVFKEIESRVWLSQKSLVFNQGSFLLEKGIVDFSGEIDLTDQDLSLQLQGEKIDADIIKPYLNNYPEFAGEINFKGEISRSLNNPLLDLDVSAAEAKLENFAFDDLSTSIKYQDRVLTFNDLNAASQDRLLGGSGQVDFSSNEPQIQSQLSVENIAYQNINEYIDFSLPVTGKINSELNIEGQINDPEIKGTLISEDTVLKTAVDKLKMDKVGLTFVRKNKGNYFIDNLNMEKGDSLLKMQGEIDQKKIDFSYNLQHFDLEQVALENRVRGLIDLEGNIGGKFSDPEISGGFTFHNLGYKDVELNSSSGDIVLVDNDLKVKNWDIDFGSGEYLVSGNIFSILSEPRYDLNLEVSGGEMQPILALADINLPLELDYKLKGAMKLTGPLTDPLAEVELSGYSDRENNGSLNLTGTIADNMDLKISGDNIYLHRTLNLDRGKVNLKGQAGFKGDITGSPKDISLNFNTDISEGKVNDFDVDSISGKIQLEDGNKIYLDQDIMINGNKIMVKGTMPGNQYDDMNLQMNFDKLALDTLGEDVPILSEIRGYLEGKVGVGGSYNDPDLEGRLYLKGEDMKTDLPDEINFIEGDLVFKDQSLIFSDFSGEYGNENIDVSGKLNVFDRESFWDMSLKGKNLPFDQGSFAGKIDPDIEITGAFYQPEITGDITTRDFVAGMPFVWSETDGDGDSETSDPGVFNPELDVNVYPGKKVYLREKERIDILIEKGSLNLTHINGEFQITGELSSTQGSFDYYNNKFMLESGRAVFRPYQDYIPDLNLQAYTMVDGTRIIVRLNGPADNMVTTFDSQPRLSREEILNLLTQKGGIGGMVGGERVSMIEIISRELLRFLRESLQLDLVKNLEEDIGDIFNLDTIEIDTYEMGMDRRVNIYLGKNLSDKFYLEYSSRFTPEDREDIFSFRYDLRNNTYLRGSWDTEDDYRLMLETSIDF